MKEIEESQKKKQKKKSSHPIQYDRPAKSTRTENSLITVTFCGF